MKALVYTQNRLKFILAKKLAPKRPQLALGMLSCLKLKDIPEPTRPSDDWVTLKPRLSGICATDMALLMGQSSTSLSLFVSFPFVPGHEVVAEVVEGTGVTKGTRVVVEPTLACAARALTPLCPACAEGKRDVCPHLDQGRIAPGAMIGFCCDTGGGWGERMVAHRSQIFVVPDAVDDMSAVVVEPFCVALHAVITAWPTLGERALVVGVGTIGLLVIAALRGLGWKGEIIAATKYEHQSAMAERMGASSSVSARSLLNDLATRYGGRVLQPVLSKPMLIGGVDTVFNCFGSSAALDSALRATRPKGQVMSLGCTATLDGIDGTNLWFKELTLRGSYIYGTEMWDGRHIPTFQLALDLLAARKVDIASLVTHRWRLDQWQEAFRQMLIKKSNKAIKQVFAIDDYG